MVKKFLTLFLSVMMTGSVLTSINLKEHSSSKDPVSLNSYTITSYDTIDPDTDDID